MTAPLKISNKRETRRDRKGKSKKGEAPRSQNTRVEKLLTLACSGGCALREGRSVGRRQYLHKVPLTSCPSVKKEGNRMKESKLARYANLIKTGGVELQPSRKEATPSSPKAEGTSELASLYHSLRNRKKSPGDHKYLLLYEGKATD